MLMDLEMKRKADKFKALCDENRLRIVEELQGGEKCACELLELLSITQPTLSHHMKILCESGLVDVHKQGRWMRYSINRSEFSSLDKYLNVFMS